MISTHMTSHRMRRKLWLLTLLSSMNPVFAINNVNYINNFSHSFNPNLPNNPSIPISVINSHSQLPEDQAIYVCYRYLQSYMQNSYQSRECDTYTGYCTVLGVPRSYWPQKAAECKMQTTPCTGKWLLFGKFDKNGNNASTTPQPYAYRKYDPYRNAQAAYASCVMNKVSIAKPP